MEVGLEMVGWFFIDFLLFVLLDIVLVVFVDVVVGVVCEEVKRRDKEWCVVVIFVGDGDGGWVSDGVDFGESCVCL